MRRRSPADIGVAVAVPSGLRRLEVERMKARRLSILIAALPFVCAPAALADTSVTDRVTGDGSAIEVTSEPAGTTALHLAVMSDPAGDEIRYLNIPATQTTYTPPAATPVVDMEALGADGTIGGWSGRLQSTAPASQEEAQEEEEEAQEVGLGNPAEELAETPEDGEELAPVAGGKTHPKHHRHRKRERIEAERAAERAEEEPSAEPQPRGSMVIGVDSGGWGGSSTFSDLAKGGIHYVRTSSEYAGYVEPEASAAGVHIATVIFGTEGKIGALSPGGYAAEVASYFKKYGLAGGLTVEVLNEPGNGVFWKDPADYSAYAALAKAVHEALATLPAQSRPAELCSWDGGEASPNPEKGWGQGIKAAGALSYCDGVTVHPYGGPTGGDGGALGGRSDVELAHGESGKPVYVTEIGWPTAVGQSPTGDSQQWTEAQQAANITGFMRWAAGTGYVPMVIYFNYVDYGSNDFYGIETAQHKHKLGFAALAEASAEW
jgi:hypothetical protein